MRGTSWRSVASSALVAGLSAPPYDVPRTVPWAVEGRVVGPDGAARGDAEIRLFAGGSGAALASAVTAPDGTFQAPMDRYGSSVRIEVRAGVLAPATLAGVFPDARTVQVGTIELHEPVMLSGVVAAFDGSPVEGARVRVRPSFGSASDADRIATADAGGRFSLSGLFPAGHDVFISAGGFAVAAHRGFVVGAPDASVRFWLQPETAMHGVVVDESGAPLQGARVDASRGADGGEHETAVTEASGRFTIRGFDGVRRRFRLEAHKAGFLARGAAAPTLPTGNRIELARGRVVDVTAPRAIVSLGFEALRKLGEGWAPDRGNVDARTSEQLAPERWRVTVPSFDVLRLGATLDDGSVAACEVKDHDAAAPVALERRTETPVGGRVVDSEGKPFRHVRIEVALAADASSREILDRVACMTDGDGRYGLGARRGTVTGIFAPGGEWAFVEPQPRETRRETSGASSRSAPPLDATIALRAARISGRVTFGGRPPGAYWPLRVFRVGESGLERVASLTADAEGRFAAGGLPPGRLVLVAKRASTRSSVRSFEDEWPAGAGGHFGTSFPLAEGEVREIELACPPHQERAVAGSVYAADAPVEDLSVDLVPLDGTAWAASGATDRSGRYRVPCPSAGKYRLDVRGAGISESRVLDVREGQSRQVNFELGSGRVTGRLRDGEGGPTAIRVMLQRARDPERDPLWRVAPRETTAHDGAFAFDRVAPGRWRVVAFDLERRWASVASEPFELEEGERRDVSLTVPRAVRLVASADDPKGRTGSGRVWISAEEPSPPLACLAKAWLFPTEASLAIHGLPPGRVRVRMPAFEDAVATLPGDGGPVHVVLAPAKGAATSRPSTSAYDSREARLENEWDWGDEEPWLYEQESRPLSR